MCVGVSVWLGWSSIRVAGWRIIRRLRLFCWIITLVVLFLVRWVLEFRCGWFGVVSVLQAETVCNSDTTPTQPHRHSNTHKTKNNTTNVVIQQNSRKLLTMYILMSETSLTFTNSTFCPHSVFMCFVWIWEQTAIISLYSITWLVCVTETECVYCAVRTEHLTFTNSTFCPHSVFMCFVWIW